MSKKKHIENKPSISEFLSLDESLLNTKIFYANEWLIGDDFNNSRDSMYGDIKYSTLYLNSKMSGKTNLFAEFVENEFKKPLRDIYGETSLVEEVYPYIAMVDGENSCYLGFGKASILTSLMLKCLPETLEKYLKDNAENLDDGEVDVACKLLRNMLIDDRKIMHEVISNPESSGYCASIKCINPDGSPVLKSREPVLKQKMIELYTKRIMGTRRLPEILGKQIDINKFMELFKYDKLALIFACSAYSDLHSKINTANKVPAGALYYLYEYIDALKQMKAKYPNYRVSIDYVQMDKDKEGRKVAKYLSIDSNELLELYESLVENAPQVDEFMDNIKNLPKKFNVPKEKLDAMNPQQYSELLNELIERNNKLKSVQLNWEILPTKEGEVERETGARTGESTSKLQDTDMEVRSEAFNSYISSLNPVLCLKGKNNFDGYIAYVFGNKKVILEKPKTANIGGYYSATYVMELESFFELSKLSRAEIIEGLRNNEVEGVKRIYHTYDEKSTDPIAKYKARMEKELEGSEYDKEAIDEIYNIIEEQRVKEHENEYQRIRTKEDQN